MSNRKLALRYTSLAFAIPLANAEQPSPQWHWEIDLGVAVGYSQVLIESLHQHDRELSLTPLAAGGVYYRKLFIESTPMTNRPLTFGYSLLKRDNQQLNLIAESLFVEISEHEQERGHKLDGIDSRHASLEVGLEYYQALSQFDLRFSYLHDALGNHKGNYLSAELAYPIYTQQSLFLPSVSLEYLDSRIVDYYFGVAAHEATAHRPTYSPGGAWRTGIKLYVEHPLNASWSVLGMLKYAHVSDNISTSPLVSSRADTYSMQLGVLWSF